VRFLAVFLALACSACGSGTDRLYPVSGQVSYRGQPVAEALVVFHPLDGQPGPKPLAYTDAQGRFTLTTHQAADGARAGEYAVTVELRALTTRGEDQTRDGRHLLPVRYSQPFTSGLRHRVEPDDNIVPMWRLTD
jgi:hypothetical protein